MRLPCVRNTLSRFFVVAFVCLSCCVAGRAATAGVLLATVGISANPGEHISVQIIADASPTFGAALSWQYFTANGQALSHGSGMVVAGPTQFTVSGPCGVDQPSMNASYMEIYNDTPQFYATASGSASKSLDNEIASDSSGIYASDAQEARCGQTLFGALAAVDASNPEKGKYWNIHLEKGEKLSVNGYAVSTNLTSGAELEIEIQAPGSSGWTFVDGVAAYGFAKFGGGSFVAPAAGNYTLRAVCNTTRMCKFAIHLTVSGRQCPPPYACPCSLSHGANNLPVELAHGRERAEFGTDMDVANPIGPDVAFGRLWTENLALQKVASPGLSRGWTHSYDIRLNAVGEFDLQIQFPNGGQEIWTAVLGSNGAPTGQLTAPSGAPYKVSGVVNPMEFNPNDPNDPVTKRWNAVTVTWDDGSQWSFAPAPDRYLFRLDKQFNATGQYLQMNYNADRTLASVSNQGGANLLNLNYNSGQLASIIDVYGRRIVYTWNQPAGVPEPVLSGVSAIHTGTPTSTYSYQLYSYATFAAEGNKPLLSVVVTRANNPGGSGTTSFNTYDAAARVASTTDGNGNKHIYTYNSGQTLITVKNAGGVTVQVWTQYQDALGRDAGHADAAGNRWTIYYDDAANPLKATRHVDPMGRTTTTTYDQYGHVTSTTSPRGVSQVSTWNYSSWSLGRLVKTQVQTSTQSYAATNYTYYEPTGLINNVIAPHPETSGSTVTTHLTYDSYGNPLTVTEPDENGTTRTTSFNYLQDGAYTRPMFVGHPVAATDDLGHTTHLRYDARGNLTSRADALGFTTSTAYDTSDQVTQVTLPASGQTGSGQSKITYAYTYLGGPMHTQTVVDESNATVRTYTTTYGNEGEVKVQYGSNISQTVVYDALYRMTSFKDGANRATNYFYDGNGRLAATQYPLTNSTTGYDIETTTQWDASGLPLQRVDGRGVASNVAYTPDGLPQTLSYPTSPGETVSLSYNSFGQLQLRNDASGSESYSYNPSGRLSGQSTGYKRANGTLISPFVQEVHYKPSGALASLVTGLGAQSYGYDAVGRLTSMQEPGGAQTGWNYLNNDWMSGQVLPVGITSSVTRNALGQILAQQHQATGTTGTPILSKWGHPTDASQSQKYNALGQLTRSVAQSTAGFAWNGTTNYNYDTQSQLTQESSTRGAAWSANYTHNFGYNSAGNPTTWKGATRAFNLDNQETSGARTYDGIGNTLQLANGNLATSTLPAPTQKLVYNAQGQLSELRDASNVLIAKYVYRGDGKRAWKENAAGVRSYFYYSGDTMLAITNGADVATLLLWGADGLVGTRNTNSTTGVTSRFYHLYDPQGNLAQTVDQNGAVISLSAFSAWGEPLRDAAGNQSAGAFGYGAKFGYWRDGESGFVLCRVCGNLKASHRPPRNA